MNIAVKSEVKLFIEVNKPILVFSVTPNNAVSAE